MAAMLAAALGCGGGGTRQLERRFDDPRSPLTVGLALQREHAALAERYFDAARAAVDGMRAWLGDTPRTLTLVDPGWRADAAAPQNGAGDPDVIVLERTRWWTRPTSMAPELAVARAIAHRAIESSVDTRRLPPWFVDGLAESAARDIVRGLFARANLSPGYAMYEARAFGGFVPWFIRFRLLPERDGDPLPAYRRDPSADVAAGGHRESLAGKTVLVVAALERWLTRPVLDSAMAAFFRQARTQPPTIADFIRVVSAACGQDLSWLLVQALGTSATFDYGVAALTSAAVGAGEFETRVTVARYGDGQFTGTVAPREGPFESGRGLTIAIAFEDGAAVREPWDGRDDRKTYVYRSASPVRSALIDPDGLVTLDLNRTNNGRALAPRTAAASTLWSARWLAWLEHLLVTYSFLA